MKRSLIFCVLCSVVLALVSVSPVGRWLEREAGLRALYMVRGNVEAPQGAIVVGIDRNSVGWLQRNFDDPKGPSFGTEDCLPPNAREELKRARSINQVPRSLYACLIRRLNERNAHLVVFDINFNMDTEFDDLLAGQMEVSRNVLLLERVSDVNGGRRFSSSAPLARAAAQTVFFLVDGRDGRLVTGYPTKIHQFPDLPAMPVEAWRRYAREQDVEERPLPDFQPIWLYGPAGTVPTIPLQRVFEADGREFPEDLSRVTVFVGASDLSGESAPDHFRVPIVSTRAGVMGGVELAAMAFLNLVHRQTLASLPLQAQAGVVFCYAFTVLFASRNFSSRLALISVLAIAGGFAALALLAFVFTRFWLPVAVPLVIATPLAVLSASSARFIGARRVIERLTPRPYARELLIHPETNRSHSHVEEATVMFADMAGSTTLAEQLSQDEFTKVMNRYYSAATAAVESNDGMVVEYIGDGVLALFTRSVTGPDHATKACRAAQEIPHKLTGRLPEAERGDAGSYGLRFGIHSGSVTTGATGAEHRFSFKALGEPVIVAARLQEHGKTLHGNTADVILLTAETRWRARLSDEQLTPLGMAKLRGRNQEVEIFRLAT